MHSPHHKPIQVGEDGHAVGCKCGRHGKQAVRASDHHFCKFKVFKPQKSGSNSYLDSSNIDKMKPLLGDIADNCPAFKSWLDGSFDLKSIPKEAVDQMAAYAQKATGKTKIALADLLRLLVLTEP